MPTRTTSSMLRSWPYARLDLNIVRLISYRTAEQQEALTSVRMKKSADLNRSWHLFTGDRPSRWRCRSGDAKDQSHSLIKHTFCIGESGGENQKRQ